MLKNHDVMAKAESKKSNNKSGKVGEKKLKTLARDLQSGNYLTMTAFTVLDNGNKPVVIDKKICGQISSANIVDFERGELVLKPIKITPDWLEVLGGIHVRGNLWFFFLLHGIGINASGSTYGYNAELTKKGLVVHGLKFPPKKYVHQFQNLFYAITGHELSVDLKRIKKSGNEKLGKKK